MVYGHKRKQDKLLQEEGAAVEPKAKRFLTDSKRRLFEALQTPGTDKKPCSYSTWCKHLKTDFCDFPTQN